MAYMESDDHDYHYWHCLAASITTNHYITISSPNTEAVGGPAFLAGFLSVTLVTTKTPATKILFTHLKLYLYSVLQLSFSSVHSFQYSGNKIYQAPNSCSLLWNFIFIVHSRYFSNLQLPFSMDPVYRMIVSAWHFSNQQSMKVCWYSGNKYKQAPFEKHASPADDNECMSYTAITNSCFGKCLQPVVSTLFFPC